MREYKTNLDYINEWIQAQMENLTERGFTPDQLDIRMKLTGLDLQLGIVESVRALVEAVDKLAPATYSGETLNEKIDRGIAAIVALQKRP